MLKQESPALHNRTPEVRESNLPVKVALDSNKPKVQEQKVALKSVGGYKSTTLLPKEQATPAATSPVLTLKPTSRLEQDATAPKAEPRSESLALSDVAAPLVNVIRGIVLDNLEEFRTQVRSYILWSNNHGVMNIFNSTQVHRDVHNMHVDLIRQFQIQKVILETQFYIRSFFVLFLQY